MSCHCVFELCRSIVSDEPGPDSDWACSSSTAAGCNALMFTVAKGPEVRLPLSH